MSMLSRFLRGGARKDPLGLDRKTGSSHHRAFVGPPAEYDLVAAMTFNLLTTVGLRQQHKLLDIGCGSLRNGRLLIPYLNKGHYVGVEPNGRLIEDGVRYEIGKDLVRIKQPVFIVGDSLRGRADVADVDYAVAQSIFSHTGTDLLHRWLEEIGAALKPDGVLLATFMVDDKDGTEQGWVYPGCVWFRPETMREIAAAHGFTFLLLDWHHPRQQWALFGKPEFDSEWFEKHPLSWNARASAG